MPATGLRYCSASLPGIQETCLSWDHPFCSYFHSPHPTPSRGHPFFMPQCWLLAQSASLWPTSPPPTPPMPSGQINLPSTWFQGCHPSPTTWLSTLSRPQFPDYSITVSSQTTWLTVPKWTPSWSESLFLLGFNCLPFPMSLLKFRPWCWQRLKAGGEGDDRGWDGWTASLTQWPWVGASSGRWWKTGKPGVLQSMGSQKVRHDWAIEPQQCAFQIPASVSTHFHQHESSPTKNTPLPSFSYNMMISNLPFVPILVDNRDDQPLSSTSYLTPTLSPCP